MHSNAILRYTCALFLGAGLCLAVPAVASAAQTPSALCGGNKKKDVKKPVDPDDKKPANPASAETLCGGNKKKDVKKPVDPDDKKPANPA